jgi:hypothetical protein
MASAQPLIENQQQRPPFVRALTDIEFEQLSNMGVEETCRWVAKIGYSDFVEPFSRHLIDGEVLSLMDENHLVEIGIATVGRRVKFLKTLQSLKSAARNKKRNQVVWSAEEVRSVTYCGKLYYAVCCCVQPPEKYKMTGISLRFKSTQFTWPCCLALGGLTTINNNVDLTEIVDVDTETMRAPCCAPCFGLPDRVVVEYQEGEGVAPKTHVLRVAAGNGESTARLIRDQHEGRVFCFALGISRLRIFDSS